MAAGAQQHTSRVCAAVLELPMAAGAPVPRVVEAPQLEEAMAKMAKDLISASASRTLLAVW
jgi:hypothetical protein